MTHKTVSLDCMKEKRRKHTPNYNISLVDQKSKVQLYEFSKEQFRPFLNDQVFNSSRKKKQQRTVLTEH